MIEFRSVVETTRFVDPAGRPAEQVIEHRTDPLTSTVASINAALGEKARAFLGSGDVALLAELERSSRAGCPFCAAGEKGTRFDAALATEGQLRVGRSLAMPNLFSKCRVDAVVIVNHLEHTLFPSRIAAADLATAFEAAREVLRRARRLDPALAHHLAGMNFLHPGGSSVPHPHLQVHVRSVPYSGVARLVRASDDFLSATGRSYWEELVERERELGARHVGRSGRVDWLAAFAPGHQKEIWGVLPGVGSLEEAADADLQAFAEGVSRVVSFYEAGGTHPFTLAFLSAPAPGRGGSFALQVRICSRPAFRSLYANYDTWFGPKLAGDDVHTEAPEAYAAALRPWWGAQPARAP